MNHSTTETRCQALAGFFRTTVLLFFRMKGACSNEIVQRILSWEGATGLGRRFRLPCRLFCETGADTHPGELSLIKPLAVALKAGPLTVEECRHFTDDGLARHAKSWRRLQKRADQAISSLVHRRGASLSRDTISANAAGPSKSRPIKARATCFAATALGSPVAPGLNSIGWSRRADVASGRKSGDSR